MSARSIVILEGDETGQELLEESLRVLDPGVIRLPLQLSPSNQVLIQSLSI